MFHVPDGLGALWVRSDIALVVIQAVLAAAVAVATAVAVIAAVVGIVAVEGAEIVVDAVAVVDDLALTTIVAHRIPTGITILLMSMSLS